jgi:two-component system sensor histidine kinase PhoQ
MLSLNARLLLAASVVLVSFLGLTGLALDRAFRNSAETAFRDRLQGYIYALLAAADLQPDGVLSISEELPELRLTRSGSGLYAQIVSPDGRQYWQSPSMLGVHLPVPAPLLPGSRVFLPTTNAEGIPFYTLVYGVSYVGRNRAQYRYTFGVTEGLDSLNAQIQSFRRSLWGWLGGAALVLVAVQGSILRWSLTPLRRAEHDLLAVERGERSELAGRYPRELQGLTRNLNALLRSDRERVERYRRTLGELAHSLKTPLAILRGTLEAKMPSDERLAVLEQQITRMTQIVDYQLQRAAASGRSTLAAPIAVADAIKQVVGSLAKVYAEKGVVCKVAVTPDAVFYGAEGDLLEVLGNLLDNAYKWCQYRAQVGAEPLKRVASMHRAGLRLWVEDDGPGMSQERMQEVLSRRVQADTSMPSYGIGLRVVQDVAELYRGTLTIDRSSLGGVRVEVSMPGEAG